MSRHTELFKGLGHNAKTKEKLTWAPVDFVKDTSTVYVVKIC